MMEKVDLKDLYALKEVDFEMCESVEDVLKVIGSDCCLIEEDKLSIIDAIKGNEHDILVTKIQNIFNIFTYEDYAWIEDDNLLLDEEMDLACKFLGYYNKLVGTINEVNFRDVYKLSLFTGEQYVSNLERLEDMRDAINFASRGIGYYSGNTLDTRSEFDLFFDEEFNRVSLIKSVQKTK